MGVEAGAYCCATEGELAKAVLGSLQFAGNQGDLTEVAAEDLAETNRRSVLQMGAGDGDDVVKLPGLFTKRLTEVTERRQQVLIDFCGSRQMHDSGNDIIARLAEVDMIVGVYGPTAERFPKQLASTIGDDLIGVHVGTGA